MALCITNHEVHLTFVVPAKALTGDSPRLGDLKKQPFMGTSPLSISLILSWSELRLLSQANSKTPCHYNHPQILFRRGPGPLLCGLKRWDRPSVDMVQDYTARLGRVRIRTQEQGNFPLTPHPLGWGEVLLAITQLVCNLANQPSVD